MIYYKIMIVRLTRQYSRAMSILVAIALLSVGVLSTVHFGMDMSGGDKGVNCPFAGITHSMCSGNPLDDLSVWQGLIAVVPPHTMTAILSMLLATLFVFTYASRLSLRNFQIVPLLYTRHTTYGHSPPRSALKEAFSRGVLHPKLF